MALKISFSKLRCSSINDQTRHMYGDTFFRVNVSYDII